MVIRELRQFNLRQIALSGQCFRMTEIPVEEISGAAEEISKAAVCLGDGEGCGAAEEISRAAACPGGSEGYGAAEAAHSAYRVISGSRILTVAQAGETVTFFCGEEEFPYWENYFDLQTDYGRFVESVDGKDAYLQRAAAFGSGIRILRQDVWEMIITFVISQQKTIPAIRSLVEGISERYGSRITSGGNDFYAFPTPCQLSRAALEELQQLKLGYRAKYIYQICRDVCSGALDLEKLKSYDYPAAFAYLQQFYGIGGKVANCVCLFGLHHIGAFPVDTWIHKVLMKEYACRCRPSVLDRVPRTRQCDFLVKKFFSKYKGYAGVMQQYIFYYERYAVPR